MSRASLSHDAKARIAPRVNKKKRRRRQQGKFNIGAGGQRGRADGECVQKYTHKCIQRRTTSRLLCVLLLSCDVIARDASGMPPPLLAAAAGSGSRRCFVARGMKKAKREMLTWIHNIYCSPAVPLLADSYRKKYDSHHCKILLGANYKGWIGMDPFNNKNISGGKEI
jgi:hypothetical protein